VRERVVDQDILSLLMAAPPFFLEIFEFFLSLFTSRAVFIFKSHYHSCLYSGIHASLFEIPFFYFVT
jgi:hypothetical protein